MTTPAQLELILLADDEEDIRTVAEMSLRVVGGWTVLQAATGLEAVEVAERLRPDLILLDVMMPGMDGVSAFRELRARPSTRSIPIVFMTAKVQRREVQDYLALGALGVIEKPFSPLELPNLVRRLVGC